MHDVAGLSHKNVVSSNFWGLGLDVRCELLKEHSLTELKKIQQDFMGENAALFSNESEWTVFHLGKLLALFRYICDHVFANFDHQYSVVTLSS